MIPVESVSWGWETALDGYWNKALSPPVPVDKYQFSCPDTYRRCARGRAGSFKVRFQSELSTVQSLHCVIFEKCPAFSAIAISANASSQRSKRSAVSLVPAPFQLYVNPSAMSLQIIPHYFCTKHNNKLPWINVQNDWKHCLLVFFGDML